MIIIALEGLDKSGKNTQRHMLHDALEFLGFRVESSEFHRYDTPTGQLIRRFLDGDYKANQLAIECLMAADKYAQLDWFAELEENKTDVLILDRYTLSQIAYGSANGVRRKFIRDLLQNLPKPDYTFYLELDPYISMERKGQHGDNDIYESNFDLLEEAACHYSFIISGMEKEDQAMLIDATDTPQQIHQQILEKVYALILQEVATA